MWQLILDLLIALTAFLAGAFWFLSASVRIPKPRGYWGGGEIPDDDPFYLATKRASDRNRLAAFWAGVSAILTVLNAGGHVGAAYQAYAHPTAIKASAATSDGAA